MCVVLLIGENKFIYYHLCILTFSKMSSTKRTHRSRAQKRDDAHIAMKRARGDYIAPDELPNFDEIPLGTDNGSHYHEMNAR